MGQAKTKTLNDKEKRFVEEYLVDRNAARAAFDAGVSLAQERIGFYVYFLIDPRDGEIFYIGKGSGNRASHHVNEWKSGRTCNAPKVARIADIKADGCDVIEAIFRCGLSEQRAFQKERELILALADAGLTNIAQGVLTDEEVDRARAELLLSRLKSFERWNREMRPSVRDWVESQYGTTKAFYDLFVDRVKEFAGNPPPRYITAVLKSFKENQTGLS